MRIRLIWSIVFLWGMVFVSCSGEKTSVNIIQHTDPAYVTGIALFQDAVYCATKGGLVKWELPDSRYTVFTTADGLPSNVLSDVIVDREGKLWIGTVDGIAVFDGATFKCYGISPGLPSVEINDLAIDGSGTLWAATAKGVVSFAQGRFKPLDEEKGPGKQLIMYIYFDRGDNIWIGTKEGVYFKQDGKWRRSTTMNGLPSNSVDTITQAWDMSMWEASPTGISRFDGVGWQIFGSMNTLGTIEARYLTSTEDRLWFFTPNGVHASRGAEWFHFTEEDGLISNDVTCGYVESNEKIYVGTVDGMSVIVNGNIENYFVPNSLVGYNCISITIDDRDRIWLGTWETGLNLYDSGFWTQLRGRDGKILATVRSIVFGSDGGFVFNTMGGVVFKNENRWVIQTRADGISGNDVRCGVYDDKDRYWVGTASGICYYEKGRWKRFRSFHGLPSEDTWACGLDKNSTVWFGTTKGIVSFTDNVLSDRTPEIDIEEIDVRSIAVEENRILFGTNNGKLIVYDNGSWNVYGNNYLGTDKGIHAITVDASGVVWFGTNGDGIIGLENGKKTQLTISDGLPSNYVRALAYRNGTLWAACYGGAAKIEIKKSED